MCSLFLEATNDPVQGMTRSLPPLVSVVVEAFSVLSFVANFPGCGLNGADVGRGLGTGRDVGHPQVFIADRGAGRRRPASRLGSDVPITGISGLFT